MKRREFLAVSAFAAAAGIGGQASGEDGAGESKQYLELRHYEFASAEKRAGFELFLGGAAVPALNRLGIGPVGVFVGEDEKEEAGMWVLLPHRTLESVMTSNTKMLGDAEFKAAGGDVLNSAKEDPAYTRCESCLLGAFAKCPKVEEPSKKEGRIFQLRIYESHNEIYAKRKVEMFDEAGEIELFRETGLKPVFFGECIVGSRMPNLAYMVGFDDADSQKKAWERFVEHAEWKRMSTDPYYKDTVSNVTNIMLRPSGASQI